ncbi:MAG TPA: vWA domain-containing protein [Candidatus Nanoarchaeia archaeon]|nr:vWA domain-containing protein [Candidatus Nanoarchaeia archaeon]
MKRFITRSCLQLALAAGLIMGCEVRQQPALPAGTPEHGVAGSLQQPPEEQEPSLVKNYYFIIDCSGSMNDPIARKERLGRKIDGAKAAVRKFMESVPDDVNIGLAVFYGAYFSSDGLKELVPIGRCSMQRQLFLAAVNTLQGGGGTPLGQSIIFGTKKLLEQKSRQLDYGEFHLVLVTDGDATDDLMNGVNFMLQSPGITAHTIGLGIGREHELNNPKYVSSYVAADDFNQLAAALEDVVQAESEDFVAEFK